VDAIRRETGPGRRKQRFFLVELESKVQMVEMAQWTTSVSPLPRRLLGHYIRSGFLAGAVTLGSSSMIFSRCVERNA
jgi:hypothetical protein